MLSCIIYKQVDVDMVATAAEHGLDGVSITRVKILDRLLAFSRLQCLAALCTTFRFFC